MEHQEEEELLDFDRAMRDFTEMFPRVSPAQIELVLRKYDGDVSATINELLFDDNSAPTSSTFRPGEDVLTRLRRRRHEINERLRENQRLLDTVTDVESARTYEDQQLAYLLEHREVSELIKAEKTRTDRHGKHTELPKPRETPQKTIQKTSEAKKKTRRSSEDVPIPDGPYVGPIGDNNLASRIRGTFKKGSGSRFSRLFSTP